MADLQEILISQPDQFLSYKDANMLNNPKNHGTF